MEQLLEQLYMSGLRFLEPMTPESTYKRIVDEALKLVNADSGAVYVMKGRELKKAYTSSKSLATLRHRKHGFTYQAWRYKKPFILSSQDIYAVHPEFKKIQLKSFMLMPISYGKEVIGVLTLQSKKENYFTHEMLKLIRLYTSMAYLSIRKTQLYAQAKESLELQDLLIAMTSHELKTPLTTISIYSQMLEKSLSKRAKINPIWVKEIGFETKRLQKLLHELLQSNVITNKSFQYDFSPYNIHTLLEKVRLNFLANYPNYHLEIRNSLKKEEGMLTGDFDKILQAFNNIIGNAAKYSPPSAPITLSVELEKKIIILKIIDQGKGIPQKDLPLLFDKFYRGKNSRHEGMGIGLFLAKNIIEKHKGKIEITSQINKGTTVQICLPLK